MEGEREFLELGLPLNAVRSVVWGVGGSSALILTSGSATIIEHSVATAAAVVTYLRSKGIPIYGDVEEVPPGHAPEGDVIVEPL